MNIRSKLPNVGTTIFTTMSALAAEHRAINLSQGFPNYDPPELLKNLVFQNIQKGNNQYAPMPGLLALREAISEKIDFLYKKNSSPDTEITITAGGTQALFTAIAAFVEMGDEVIIIEPAYDSYRPCIEMFGGTAVVYELASPHFSIDWEAFAKLISPKTKMVILNTPHNPTGKIWHKSDMLALSKLVKGSNILILSDEVYEHLIFDGEQHESVLRYPELYERSLVVFSFGKTFHNTGWKIGYCIAPDYLTKEFRKVHQFNVFSVNSPIQFALSEFLSKREHYLELPSFYQAKRDFFLAILAQTRFRPIACEGTYFQLASYEHISEEPDVIFSKKMTTQHGVAVIPVSVFYSSGKDERLVRFCFAKTNDLLEAAGERLRLI